MYNLTYYYEIYIMNDTLLIGGGGTKGNILIGALKALLDKGLIKEDYSNITTYVTCSVGSIIAFLMCCNFTPTMISKLPISLNYIELLDYDDIDILFKENGLFSNDKIINIVRNILYTLFKIKDITLLNFFKLTGKTFICKVYNLSEFKVEYFSHENNPDLSLCELIKMTTCIPIFFKPIRYNNKYYVDGGVKGSMVEYSNYDNYIGLCIHNKKQITDENIDIQNMNPINYIKRILKALSSNNNDEYPPKIICVHNEQGEVLDFDINNNKKTNDIKIGYKIAIDHIEEYGLDIKD